MYRLLLENTRRMGDTLLQYVPCREYSRACVREGVTFRMAHHSSHRAPVLITHNRALHEATEENASLQRSLLQLQEESQLRNAQLKVLVLGGTLSPEEVPCSVASVAAIQHAEQTMH